MHHVIGHTADIHEGVRDEELEKVMGFIATDGEERGVTLWVLPGDLYDHGSSIDERNRLIAILTKMANVAPVVICYGNHDVDGDLDKFEHIEAAHPIYVFAQPAIMRFRKNLAPNLVSMDHQSATGTDLLLCILPWPRKAGMVARLGRPVGPEESSAIAVAELKNILAGFKAAVDQHPGPSLLMAHAQVLAARTSCGQPLVGCDMEIAADDLAAVGATYGALGHIHCRQEVAPRIWYPGSPRRTAHGELEAKGYNLVRISDDGALATALATGGPQLSSVYSWQATVDFRETPCAPMYDVTVTFDEDSLCPCKVVGLPPEGARDADVRVRYEVPEDKRRAYRERVKFATAMLEVSGNRVKVEEQVIPVQRSKGEERISTMLSEARTTWDKVVACIQARGGSSEPERMRSLYRLLTDIETALGVAPARGGGGGIRVDAIRLSGFLVFDDPVELVIKDIPGTVVAITGENGAGKSTFLGAVPAAFYREFPGERGALPKWAKGRNSYVEVDFKNGANYRARVTVDASSGKSEAFLEQPTEDVLFGSDGRKDEWAAVPGVTGKVSAFDAWVKEHLPSMELYFASAFAPQGNPLDSKGRPLDPIATKPAARKEMLVELLGFSYLERLADAARGLVRPPASRKERAVLDPILAGLGSDGDGLEAQAVRLEAQLAEARRAVAGIGDLARSIEQLTEQAAAADADAGAAEAETKRRVDALGAWDRARVEIEARGREARAEARAADEAHASAHSALAAALERAEAGEARLKGIDRLIAASSDVEAAAREAVLQEKAVGELEAVVAQRQAARREAEAEEEEARACATAASAEAAEAGHRHAAIERSLVQLRQRMERARQAIADLPAARAAGARAEYLSARHQAAEAALAELVDRVRRSEIYDQARRAGLAELGATLRQAEARRDDLIVQGNLIDAVPCRGEGDFSGCALLGRAIGARAEVPTARELAEQHREKRRLLEAEDGPSWYLDHEERSTTAAKRTVADLGAEWRETDRAAARLADLEKTAAELEEVEAGADNEAAAATAASAVSSVADEVARAAAAIASRLCGVRVDARHEVATAERGLAEGREVLAGAQRRAGRSGEIIRAREDRADAQAAALKGRRELAAATGAASVAVARRAERQDLLRRAIEEHSLCVRDRPLAPEPDRAYALRRVVDQIEAQITSDEGRLRSMADQEAHAVDVERAMRSAHEALADARLLADLLGRDGIQALEIDAAAPAISALINQLLAECYGTRFSLSLDTLRASADGKKEIEGLTLRVIDTLKGTDGDAREVLSGGEKVIVGEALRLAITIYGARAAGASGGTLFRDEFSAGLSPANEPAYVAMLRKAANLGEFSHVLFVSHSVAMQRMADCTVHIEGGRLEVR